MSTPADVEQVEARLAQLRMEQAAIDTRRIALLRELSALVAALPPEVKLGWMARNGV